MSDDPVVQLGALLSGTEAAQLAAWLSGGSTLTKALASIAPDRRPTVRKLLTEAGLAGSAAVPVLRAIEGAHRQHRGVEPVWTVPAGQASYGHLTAAVKNLVLGARESVVCSTYNFQKSSALWTALAEVTGRGSVGVTVYLDAAAASKGGPSPEAVAAHLSGARIYRTRASGGHTYRNHAKWIALDHQVLIVTSANFSVSAEKYNVEFGLVVRDAALTQMVEKQLFDLQPTIYRLVKPQKTSG